MMQEQPRVQQDRPLTDAEVAVIVARYRSKQVGQGSTITLSDVADGLGVSRAEVAALLAPPAVCDSRQHPSRARPELIACAVVFFILVGFPAILGFAWVLMLAILTIVSTMCPGQPQAVRGTITGTVIMIAWAIAMYLACRGERRRAPANDAR